MFIYIQQLALLDARESPGHRLPKNPSSAEYTSVGVQTSLFAPGMLLECMVFD
jgi:hypothetical protein